MLDSSENVFGEFGNPMDLYFGGDMEAAIALSGQVAGRISKIRTVQEIISETVNEFSKTIERLSAK